MYCEQLNGAAASMRAWIIGNGPSLTPEMLDALVLTKDWLTKSGCSGHLVDVVRAAIRKAVGG